MYNPFLIISGVFTLLGPRAMIKAGVASGEARETKSTSCHLKYLILSPSDGIFTVQ